MTGDHDDIILILNKHGTAIANSQFHLGKAGTDIHLEKNRQTPLGRPHQAFLDFVLAVEEEKFRNDYLKDPSAPETITY